AMDHDPSWELKMIAVTSPLMRYESRLDTVVAATPMSAEMRESGRPIQLRARLVARSSRSWACSTSAARLARVSSMPAPGSGESAVWILSRTARIAASARGVSGSIAGILAVLPCLNECCMMQSQAIMALRLDSGPSGKRPVLDRLVGQHRIGDLRAHPVIESEIGVDDNRLSGGVRQLLASLDHHRPGRRIR